MSVCETLRLVPFEPELLPSVLPWFDHPEVQRRLGGRSWPARELALRTAARGEQFRGQTVLRAHSYVALDADGTPVALIGGDVYDRWTQWDPATEQVVATDERRTMGAAYVVDPARWRHGYGTATLRALVTADELADVEQFVLGVEPDNTASLRTADAVGFGPLTTEPDAEGLVYLHRAR
ncbi:MULTISPECIES: GNAT family N-acetyltransferase [unclassified Modestobacter]|uniref:GNAT family N-acetyltransferase n=1 Tax=unclassified Modestobacter TaxID=2643866 RepID=UPI0022AAE051|nr:MULTISPECIES: GNAT family protein [unclassified Modestobacter]MCZ2810046.1 GNAT family protein [Modestobacter sp. VKM Ac-2979]MCZ2844677.1 GNAT family protein [Modestobacter sp. VKM Ac-2980]MCZ2847156.1 GNAT family protein [Modestobacter sp. VKM Ac-2978]